jgi:hypothetical protein
VCHQGVPRRLDLVRGCLIVCECGRKLQEKSSNQIQMSSSLELRPPRCLASEGPLRLAACFGGVYLFDGQQRVFLHPQAQESDAFLCHILPRPDVPGGYLLLVGTRKPRQERTLMMWSYQLGGKVESLVPNFASQPPAGFGHALLVAPTRVLIATGLGVGSAKVYVRHVFG